VTGRALSAEAKAAFWKANDKLAQRWEAKFAAEAARQFEHDRREVLALLTDAKEKSLDRKATVDWQDYLLNVDDYLKIAGDESWRKAFLPLIRGVIEARVAQLNADFGMEFDVRNLFAEEWFDEYVLKFAQPIMATTADDISRLMQTAQEEGWSIPQMDKALDELFNQYINGGGLSEEARQWFADRTPAYRKELISRTETIRASNAGSNALYKDWGAKQKEWLATSDERTRPEHVEANGQVVGMDEKFSVGGEDMEYPGDPAGSPSNFCNCRCTVLPVIE
jgi:SPP1 gp7 family putative phage head morphogenesis protein